MIKKLVPFLLACIAGSSLALTGCGTKEVVATSAPLSYNDGINADGSYDTDLFYRNDLLVTHAADPDCIWVSEEENAEYGGYFYMYATTVGYNFSVMRSKDLNDWERVGLALDFDGTEWAKANLWAPEVTYCETDNKYYLYASASTVLSGAPQNSGTFTEMFVAVSDNPAGGFKLSTQDAYGRTYDVTKESNFTWNTSHGSGSNNTVTDMYGKTQRVKSWDYSEVKTDAIGQNYNGFWCIDPSPFRDDDGQWYMVFRANCNFVDPNLTYDDRTHIAVCKMIDMVTPDYSSIQLVAYGGYRSVADAENHISDPNDHKINEAPQMYKHNNVYYLTYACGGYGERAKYCAAQAVGPTPFGPFVKLKPEHANPTLFVEGYMDQMSGAGHHTIVERGDEMFIIYHSHMDRATGNSNPRGIAYDRIQYISGVSFGIKASDYGLVTPSGTFDILYTNGASWSLQPLMSSVSGYANVAKNAVVFVSNGKRETVGYLNDGLFANHHYSMFMEFESDGATEITLSWQDPVSIRSVMVYNSISYSNAFAKVDRIEFELAAQPASWKGSEIKTAYISDLAFDPMYYNAEELFMRPGGSCHAAFDEISVNKIKIVLSEKLDKDAQDSIIKVSDIVVLGKI